MAISQRKERKGEKAGKRPSMKEKRRSTERTERRPINGSQRIAQKCTVCEHHSPKSIEILKCQMNSTRSTNEHVRSFILDRCRVSHYSCSRFLSIRLTKFKAVVLLINLINLVG